MEAGGSGGLIMASQDAAAAPVAKLAVRGISKSFERRGQTMLALDNISFEIEPGEFFVVVGPSGCGKTTFLRIVQGLDAPTSGTVLLSGRPLTGPGADRGFVFQHDSLFPWRTVLRNVTFGAELKGVERKAAERAAREIVALVGLSGFESHYPHELSGGMRQRVNLARALAVDPDILLMDEPFAALDAITRETMQQELIRIVERTGKTVLFITHQIDEAVLLADRIVVFSARPGRVQKMITVDLPKPRALGVKRSPQFHQLVDEVWCLIGSGHASGAGEGGEDDAH
jgi:NitT/TauT family transport system ATP-binding protein